MVLLNPFLLLSFRSSENSAKSNYRNGNSSFPVQSVCT